MARQASDDAIADADRNLVGSGEVTVGRLLRSWRNRTLLTQEELAARAGVNVRTIRRLERPDARTRPHPTSIQRLAQALNLDDAERALLASLSIDSPPGEPSAGSSTVGRTGHGDRFHVITPRQLPAAPPWFTGRSLELAELTSPPDAGTVTVGVIDGMPGAGKTALATAASHRLAQDYPDGQLFIDLHGHNQHMRAVEPLDALERMLRTLGIPADHIAPNLDDRAAQYRDRLAGTRTLIVLDDVLDHHQVAPLLPGTPGSRVLITSRRRHTDLYGTQLVTLDVLPPTDAVAMFRRVIAAQRLRRPASPAEVAEIVEICDRLPLAIRIAAGQLISHPSWSCADLIHRLRDGHHRLSDRATPSASVAAALDLSYHRLDLAHQRTYRLLGLHGGPDIDVGTAAALTGENITRTRTVLDNLIDMHLLQERAPGRYHLHDVVRQHAAIATTE